MASHNEAMRKLIECSRERRALKRDVYRMDILDVVDALEQRSCSIAGSANELRDRLLRALIREIEPENDAVPWNAERDENLTQEPLRVEKAKEKVDMSAPDVPSRRGRGRPKQETSENIVTAEVHREDEPAPAHAANSSSGDEQRREREWRVPASEASVPVTVVSASSVTAAVTTTTSTMAGSSGRAQTTVTQAVGRSDLADVRRTLFAMEQVPRAMMEPQLHNYPVEFINWECYAAKFMGAQRQPAPVAAPRLPQPTPRSDARVSYVTPSQTQQQRWYTPAQEWSEIRNVESSGDSEERRSTQHTPPPKQEPVRSQSKASSIENSSELSAQVREAYSRMQNVLELRRLVKARGGERSQRNERVRYERKMEASESEKGSSRRKSTSHRQAVDGARTHPLGRETVLVASRGREKKDKARGRVSRTRKESVIDVTDSESEMSLYEERRKTRSKKRNACKPKSLTAGTADRAYLSKLRCRRL